MRWTDDMSVWVSRPDAEGFIATASLPAWLVFAVFVIAVANAVGWGIYGLVALVTAVIL